MTSDNYVFRNTDCIDVMPLYSELAKDSDYAITHAASPNDYEGQAGTSRGRRRVRICYLCDISR